MKRKNCWEIMNCGRQQGGENAEKLGVCPASKPSEYDGTNKGTFAGRFCWAVAGTFCHGKQQGTYAKKLLNCINCEFLKQVNEKEGREFVLIPKDDFVVSCLKDCGFKKIDSIEREPYPDIEYQSRRAYVFATKPED